MQKTLHEDNWFRAEDFTADGKEFVIDYVELKEIAHGVEKLVVFFLDESKGFVLNELNRKIIEKNTKETNTNNWKGYKITLYSTAILVNNQSKACIRVKILVNTLADRVA